VQETVGRRGDWAEIRLVLLAPGARAPGLPQDTERLPLEARVKGFLAHDARAGEEATVTTVAGRRVEGMLLRVLPEPGHSFGGPVPELLPVGGELRARLGAMRDHG
jgi:hypothetical protein